ncbi:MAG: redoxin family protein [Myxococcales bacterium]|nr:redoxin family protein [Myxococcales bacterium]
MRTIALSCILASTVIGCGGDPDGDGLKSKDEKELGLDPKNADSDGDGLPDGQEIEMGADPLVQDTDGDGLLDGEEAELGSDPTLLDSDGDTYSDWDEVQEGFDPADPESRIYAGYWPYNPDKDAMGDGSFTGAPLPVGTQFPRFTDGSDQFKEKLDLYDFGGRGYTVIDGSATWCGPCQAMATWLANGAKDDPYGYENSYRKVRKAVEAGELGWVTVMTDGDTGPATQQEVKSWDKAFPNEKVPVITDPNADILYAVNYDGSTYIFWPSFVVLDADMKVVYRGGGSDTLAFLAGNL